MSKDKLTTVNSSFSRVLLTRPTAKSHQLASVLSTHSIMSICQPLVEIVALEPILPVSILNRADIVIAISENALHFAQPHIETWPTSAHYLAVGQATRKKFTVFGIDALAPDSATTEGLLSLPCLMDVTNKNIVIIRGQGGRETLAKTLKTRGANVEYVEVYQRHLVDISSSSQEQWRQQHINTIVVTSGEILQHLYTTIDPHNRAWLKDIWLIVPSARIAHIANNLGAKHVSVSAGADNESILQILLNK